MARADAPDFTASACKTARGEPKTGKAAKRGTKTKNGSARHNQDLSGKDIPAGVMKIKVPPEEECYRLFDRIDYNGNGTLSMAELDKAVT
jgi:membrane protein involved in colicin uptake